MPILPNPRHEAFARAIFAGIFDSTLYPTHGHAYNAAGYRASNIRHPTLTGAVSPAEVNASRLLRNAKILDRVRELQAHAAERAQESADKCVQELNQLRCDAHSDKAYGAAVAAVMGKAKILNFVSDKLTIENPQDFSNVTSMQDIGRKLLEQVGFVSPDHVSIQAAVEANDRLVAELEAIRDAAQGLTINQDDD